VTEIVPFSPLGSPGTLFDTKFHTIGHRKTPIVWGPVKIWVAKVEKNKDLRPINRFISKTIECTQLQWKTNRKSHMGWC